MRFHAGQGTVDMIVATCQLQGKCLEQHRDLYTTFVDLPKAFDTVSRDGLCKIVSKFGCPTNSSLSFASSLGACKPKSLMMVNCRFFPSLQRCKQGCVLAPTVLSLMSSAMLKGAFRDCDAGIRINHRSGHRLPKVSDSKTASRSLR